MEVPRLADISAHTVFGWIVISNNLEDLFDPLYRRGAFATSLKLLPCKPDE